MTGCAANARAGGSATHAAVLADDSRAPAPLLGPGDVIRLRVWREPDLSDDFRIDESGVVLLPMLGPYRIEQQTAEEFRARLVTAYAAYLRDPSIDVVLLRRVNVLGAVRNPGLYTADLTMTVADVLALAGGVAPDGDPRRIELIRGGRSVSRSVERSMLLSASAIRSRDQLYVKQRSWAARNTGVLTAAVSSLVTIVIVIFR